VLRIIILELKNKLGVLLCLCAIVDGVFMFSLSPERASWPLPALGVLCAASGAAAACAAAVFKLAAQPVGCAFCTITCILLLCQEASNVAMQELDNVCAAVLAVDC
jgi:drug/metabolite transporter (DMT)-like permease